MIINTLDYPIENGIGEFAAGAGLTDSLIGIIGQDGIASIAYGASTIISGFNVMGCYLDFSNEITTSNNTILKLNLKYPLTINKNDV